MGKKFTEAIKEESDHLDQKVREKILIHIMDEFAPSIKTLNRDQSKESLTKIINAYVTDHPDMSPHVVKLYKNEERFPEPDSNIRHIHHRNFQIHIFRDTKNRRWEFAIHFPKNID